jgi:hypothetical protein
MRIGMDDALQAIEGASGLTLGDEDGVELLVVELLELFEPPPAVTPITTASAAMTPMTATMIPLFEPPFFCGGGGAGGGRGGTFAVEIGDGGCAVGTFDG